MDNELEKTSEDILADIDFDEEDKELKNSEFISIEPREIKVQEKDGQKFSQFYGEDNK
ncbi:MAG: hypothetical protein Q4F80_07665 [bacterium]|nr:hypothetical protein [bacterium]